MLDLLKFFRELGTTPYCVVKMADNFPTYREGEDIDIFCYSVEEFTKRIITWGKPYVEHGYNIKVSKVDGKQHVHVDLCRADAIQFRFDLYGELPAYRKLLIKPALFESIVEHGQPVRFQSPAGAAEVVCPAPVDDLLIRYLEFMEFYDVRPAKIKHIDFIMERGDEETRHKLVEKLHHYTQLPPIFIPKECPFCRLTGRIKKYLPG